MVCNDPFQTPSFCRETVDYERGFATITKRLISASVVASDVDLSLSCEDDI